MVYLWTCDFPWLCLIDCIDWLVSHSHFSIYQRVDIWNLPKFIWNPEDDFAGYGRFPICFHVKNVGGLMGLILVKGKCWCQHGIGYPQKHDWCLRSSCWCVSFVSKCVFFMVTSCWCMISMGDILMFVGFPLPRRIARFFTARHVRCPRKKKRRASGFQPFSQIFPTPKG